MRHGQISKLLPDPGDSDKREKSYRRFESAVVAKIKAEQQDGRASEQRQHKTRGGNLYLERGDSLYLDCFSEKIREAYCGRAPSVLDLSSGVGAIPLEAMRLGSEATAVSFKPVAWLACMTLPLPDFARSLVEAYLEVRGFNGMTPARKRAVS